ncbi:7408_t:CDS:2 [Rhizophagus irregularis]|nr:7408_t:CDS:2 [Rhizophagus irregularis]
MKNHKLYDRLCRKCFNLLINILRRTCNDGQGEAAHSTFATAAAELDDYFKFWNMFAFRLPLVIAFAAVGGTVSSTTPRKSKPSRIPRPKVLEGDLELLREFQEQFLRRAPQHLPGPDPTTLSANASRPTTPSVVSRPLPQYSIKMPRLLISILITPTQIVRNNVSDQ